MVDEGRFPAPIQLPGISTNFWDEGEVDQIVDRLIEVRDRHASA